MESYKNTTVELIQRWNREPGKYWVHIP
jgi:hypothetical protein